MYHFPRAKQLQRTEVSCPHFVIVRAWKSSPPSFVEGCVADALRSGPICGTGVGELLFRIPKSHFRDMATIVPRASASGSHEVYAIQGFSDQDAWRALTAVARPAPDGAAMYKYDNEYSPWASMLSRKSCSSVEVG